MFYWAVQLLLGKNVFFCINQILPSSKKINHIFGTYAQWSYRGWLGPPIKNLQNVFQPLVIISNIVYIPFPEFLWTLGSLKLSFKFALFLIYTVNLELYTKLHLTPDYAWFGSWPLQDILSTPKYSPGSQTKWDLQLFLVVIHYENCQFFYFLAIFT